MFRDRRLNVTRNTYSSGEDTVHFPVICRWTVQTETRVQRQLVLENGKVIADTGPQITTRTTEDNKVEESEDTQVTFTASRLASFFLFFQIPLL